MTRILIIHGPNLNLLGEREPALYGTLSLEELNSKLGREARGLGLEAEFFQSNHEGELIDRLHRARSEVSGVLLNPGGFTHTSISLRDAVAALSIPVLEVHLSNLFAREDFRRVDRIAPVCRGVIMGLGALSYSAGLHALRSLLLGDDPPTESGPPAGMPGRSRKEN